ncbi:MAG TPA: hypothetical protein VN735_06895 [Steroidobacteraceae bacterium]|nr:hypothetical protein [Steroidobacteraceae bacterium]
MEPPQRSKSNPTPPSQSAAGTGKAPPKDTRSGAASQSPRPSDPYDPIPSGRVRHDDRGNAVWDWLKETGKNAIGTTSRLLKKLELSHLKVEDKKDEELRIQTDRDPGGGYDPYNQSDKPQGGPPRKGR